MSANERPILLIGAGGHATACIDVIERHGVFTVAGLVGLVEEVGRRVLDYPVVGTDADLLTLHADCQHALVGMGHIKSCRPRRGAFEMLQRIGFDLPVIVSPLAYVSKHAALGAGTIVMHDAVVNAGAVVGRNCIINTQSLIEHDAVIADHCHIATAAVINGGARVGVGTFVGSNSTVRELDSIGADCVIGMGQRVLADCAPATVVTKGAS